MTRARLRGSCPVCGREYVVRYDWSRGGALALIQHGQPEACAGSGLEPVNGSTRRTR